MIRFALVVLATSALMGAAHGKRKDYHPIDFDNLPTGPPGSRGPVLGSTGPPPNSEDFPRLSSPNPSPSPEEFPPLGPASPGFLGAAGPPAFPPGLPPPDEPPLPGPPGSRRFRGPPSPPDNFPPLGPIEPAPPGYPGPPGHPGPNGRLPPGPPRYPADEFPPLGPSGPRERNFSPHRYRSPGGPGAPGEQLGPRGRSPSRRPSSESALSAGGHNASLAAGDQSYSHLILAIQWSGGVCADGYNNNRPVAGPPSQNTCLRGSKRDHWTIHGLWPANDYQSPEFCTTERFDGRQLESLKGQLNRYWPSFTANEDRFFTFWRHEWQKHGTCAGDVPQLRGLVNFFKNVLNVFQRHDIKEYLRNSNIQPTKQRTYKPSEIVKAISDDYPHKFDVVCNQAQSAPQPVLSEVRFCLDKSLRPVDCQGRYIRCGNQLYYPPSE